MPYTITGKDWDSADDAVRGAYQRVGREIQAGKILFKEAFAYPELAKEMRQNHYYLREKNWTPDHFMAEPRTNGRGGVIILAHLSQLTSENKYREVAIQRNFNKSFQKALLIDGLKTQFEQTAAQQRNNVQACENCGKPRGRAGFKSFIPSFDFDKEIPALLNRFSWGILESAFQYDFAQSDKIVINPSNKLIKEFNTLIDRLQYSVYCPPCYSKIEREYLWASLTNPNTPDREQRNILRLLVKIGKEEDMQKLFEMLKSAITPRLRKIPSEVRQILPHISYVAKELYSISYFKPFFKEWLELLRQPDLFEVSLGQYIAESIYRINDEALSGALFIYMFKPPVNLFRYFRIFTQYVMNTALLQFLIAFSPEDEASQALIKKAVQGLIYSNASPYIVVLLENFQRFALSIQETIISELFFLNNPKYFDMLRTLFPPLITDAATLESPEGPTAVKIKSTLEKQLDSHIIAQFRQKDAVFRQKQAEAETIDHATSLRIQNEQREAEQLYDEWRQKPGPSPFTMEEIAKDLVSNKYRQIIQEHIRRYAEEFTQYFKTNSEPLIAFDVEEMQFQMFCILAIEVKPDLRVFVKLMAVDDIYPIRKYSYILTPKFRGWLKSIDSQYVLSHGGNEEEQTLIKESGHTQINTQDIVHNARFLNPAYASQITGEGLKHFEDFMNFQRKGCPFLKHDIKIQTFYQQSVISMDHHLTKTPQKTCQICEKEQDVFLYCLEDAFSCMLIYVYFKNHNPEIL
jgi:hypothetical protein